MLLDFEEVPVFSKIFFCLFLQNFVKSKKRCFYMAYSVFAESVKNLERMSGCVSTDCWLLFWPEFLNL